MNLRIFPPEELVDARVALPLSKSMVNRALVINALTSDAAAVELPQDVSADISVMTEALAAIAAGATAVNTAGSGSTMRFLTALLSTQEGREVTIDGDARSHRRPIGTLVEALRWCGADITFTGEEGFPPMRIRGRSLVGGKVSIPASESSQYVSAVMMVAPLMRGGLRITLDRDQVSSPYIRLTAEMMRRAGIDVESDGDELFIPETSYTPVEWKPESDWSAASFWYEVEALTSGSLVLEGLSTESRQPDVAAASIFTSLGVLTDPEGRQEGVTMLEPSPDFSPRLVLDLGATPDLVPPLAVTCAMIGVPFTFSGVGHLRVKECDRIEALRSELLKVGVMLVTEPEGTIEWDGSRGPVGEIPVFDTHGDHRMAMALAPVAAYIPGIVIKDTEVVEKSYPDFWTEFEKAGFICRDADSDDNDAPAGDE